MTRWILGHGVLTAGLGWVAAARILRDSSTFFSDLSFGGGFSVLVAYAVIVIGASFVVAEVLATRPLVRNGVQLAPAERLNLSKPSVWVPAAVSVLAAVVVVATFVAPSGR